MRTVDVSAEFGVNPNLQQTGAERLVSAGIELRPEASLFRAEQANTL